MDFEALQAIWDGTTTRDDRVHAFGVQVAAAVAEQCAQECDRLANNYGSEKRDFADAIRALFPKP